MTKRRRSASFACVEAVDAAEERDVLIDGQQLVERELLRHVADPPLDAFRIARHVHAADDRRPGGRLEEAAQHPDGRRLPGAVAAEEPEDLPARHVEAHAVDGDELAEAARQVADDDRRVPPAPAPGLSAKGPLQARFGEADVGDGARAIELGLQPRDLRVEHVGVESRRRPGSAR